MNLPKLPRGSEPQPLQTLALTRTANPLWSAIQPPQQSPYWNAQTPAATTEGLGYGTTLLRYKWTVLALAVLGGVAGVAWSLSQPKIYTAHATVEMQGLNEDFMNQRELDPTSVNYGSDSYMQTQIKILQSNTLTNQVLNRLKEAKDESVRVAPTWRDNLNRLLRQPVAPPRQATSSEALQIAAGRLHVRGSGLTRIVEIEYEDPSPQLAADFVNALSVEYREQSLEERLNTDQRTGEWLTRRREELKHRLEQAEEKLQAYARSQNLLYTADNSNVAEDKLRQLQAELSRAYADRVTKQSLYESAIKGSADQIPAALITADSAAADLRAKLADLRSQEGKALAVFTPEHPAVQKIQEQIAAVKGDLEKERANIIQRVKADYEAAQRRETTLENAYKGQTSAVSDQAEKGIQYQILKNEVDSTRRLYEGMLAKVSDAGINSALKASSVRIVDDAAVPDLPSRPSTSQNGLLGLFGGVFCGVVFAFVRAQSQERNLGYSNPTPSILSLPELGVIPSARVENAVAHARKREGLLGGSYPQIGKSSFRLLNGDRKLAALKDTFQATLTSVLFSAGDSTSLRVLVLASPQAREGKTTAVSNLAIAWAEINRRVLVIDGDVRRARMHKVFGVENSFGLTNILLETGPISEYPLDTLVRQTSVAGIDLMTAGGMTPNVSALLHSPRLTELVERMSREYDVVLIDTPPLLELPDARIFGKLADAVILVFRSGKTPHNLAMAARDRLMEDGIPVLGTILNDWKPAAGSGYSYSYKY